MELNIIIKTYIFLMSSKILTKIEISNNYKSKKLFNINKGWKKLHFFKKVILILMVYILSSLK